jgi:hypothetical protein
VKSEDSGHNVQELPRQKETTAQTPPTIALIGGPMYVIGLIGHQTLRLTSDAGDSVVVAVVDQFDAVAASLSRQMAA